MKKKIIVSIMCLVLILTGSMPAAASVVENENSIMRIGERSEIPITIIKQIDGSACGLACMQMALKSFGYNRTQAQMREEGYGVNNGTYPYEIKEYMNLALGSNTYNTKDLSTTGGLGGRTFWEEIVRSIKDDKPVFCQLDTSFLPIYHGESDMHWILANGYLIQTGSTVQYAVIYSDPTRKDAYRGKFTVSPETLEAAIRGHSSWIVSKK